MTFSHPKSRKEKYRNGDKPNNGGVAWKFFKRTINIIDYRNAKDDVNPAKNRTFDGIIHDWFVNLFIDPARLVWPGPNPSLILDRFSNQQGSESSSSRRQTSPTSPYCLQLHEDSRVKMLDDACRHKCQLHTSHSGEW